MGPQLPSVLPKLQVFSHKMELTSVPSVSPYPAQACSMKEAEPDSQPRSPYLLLPDSCPVLCAPVTRVVSNAVKEKMMLWSIEVFRNIQMIPRKTLGCSQGKAPFSPPQTEQIKCQELEISRG